MIWGRLLFSFGIAAAALSGASAGEADDCSNANLRATRIEACSRMIDAHQARDEALAALHDLRAKAHADQGDYAAQAADLGVAMRLRPDNAEALVKRGAAYFRANDTDKALADFNAAVVMAPKDASARLWRGRVYRKLSQLANAETDLTLAISLNDKDVNAWLVRGLVYDDMKQHVKAIADYDVAVNLSPDNNAAVYNRAWAKLQLKKHKDALADADACRGIDPDDADCFELRGDILFDMKDHRGAADAYAQAVSRAPDNTRLRRAHATALRRMGNLDGAISELTQALERDFDTQALYDRGWIYALSGRPDNAIADYSLILRREGADAWPGALVERGFARVVRGDLNAAAEDFLSAKDVAPGDARAALWRAALSIRLNKDSFWASWRRSDAVNALKRERPRLEAERYEGPLVQVLLGERTLAEAHRVAHIAARTASDADEAACFVDAMAGGLAMADGDVKAAEAYYAKAAARNNRTNYSCLIASAELNRLRNR
jgi:tetratricopeptide (TPR) repeat protein